MDLVEQSKKSATHELVISLIKQRVEDLPTKELMDKANDIMETLPEDSPFVIKYLSIIKAHNETIIEAAKELLAFTMYEAENEDNALDENTFEKTDEGKFRLKH